MTLRTKPHHASQYSTDESSSGAGPDTSDRAACREVTVCARTRCASLPHRGHMIVQLQLASSQFHVHPADPSSVQLVSEKILGLAKKCDLSGRSLFSSSRGKATA